MKSPDTADGERVLPDEIWIAEGTLNSYEKDPATDPRLNTSCGIEKCYRYVKALQPAQPAVQYVVNPRTCAGCKSQDAPDGVCLCDTCGKKAEKPQPTAEFTEAVRQLQNELDKHPSATHVEIYCRDAETLIQAAQQSAHPHYAEIAEGERCEHCGTGRLSQKKYDADIEAKARELIAQQSAGVEEIHKYLLDKRNNLGANAVNIFELLELCEKYSGKVLRVVG